jgi:hypothetical protein
MKKNFVKIEPNPLSLIISKDNVNKNNYNISIQNSTEKYLIFGLFINLKGILSAKPSISYILPKQNTSVEINIINNNLSLDEYKKMKIIVIIIPYNEEINSIEQAKNLFQNLKMKKIEKQEILINLNFSFEETIDTDISINNTYNDNKEEKLNSVNYTNMRSQLMNKKEQILKNLEINKKKLENLMEQNSKISGKIKQKIKKYNFDNLIIITIILLGLILGGNFAIGYNKLFNKK